MIEVRIRWHIHLKRPPSADLGDKLFQTFKKPLIHFYFGGPDQSRQFKGNFVSVFSDLQD